MFSQDKLSFPTTGGMSVSPHTLSVTAPRLVTLSYSNSEAHIQLNKVQYLTGILNIAYRLFISQEWVLILIAGYEML